MTTLAGSPSASAPSTIPSTSAPPATYVRDLGAVLAEVVSTGTGAADLPALLRRLATLTLDATGADRVSFFLLDDDSSTLRLWAAASDQGEPDLWERGLSLEPISLDAVPVRRAVVALGEPVAIEDARSSSLIPEEWAQAFDLASLVIAPLRSGDDTVGLLAVDYREHRSLPHALVQLVGTIAGVSAMAVATASLSTELARRAEQVAIGAEFARALLDVDTRPVADGGALLTELRALVPQALGFEVVSVRLAGSATSIDRSPLEQSLWRRWRQRRSRPEVHESDGIACAPIWGEAGLLGLITARPLHPPLAAHEGDLLEALAAALAETSERARARGLIELRDRELAMAAEREAVADELHSILDRFLSTLASAAAGLADAVRAGQGADAVAETARRVAVVAGAGAAELRRTADSLGAITWNPTGLNGTLDELADTLGRQLDTEIDVVVCGAPRPLAVEVERVLVAVLHATLTRVERRSRSSAVMIQLLYRDDEVALTLRDDGIDLGARDADDGTPGVHLGVRLAQRRLESLGGRMTIQSARPRGLMLTATVPA